MTQTYPSEAALMTRWEYLTEETSHLEEALKSAGNEGWELVTVWFHPARLHRDDDKWTLIFKRPKEAP
jgi:hypothetical protein